MSVQEGIKSRIMDKVAIEEPLTILVSQNGKTHNLGLTMRTPGDDSNLVRGFLYSEGIINSGSDIESMENNNDTIMVCLSDSFDFSDGNYRRTGLITSACGVCGKESLSHLPHRCDSTPNHDFKINWNQIIQNSKTLKQSQKLFQNTGGTHAAASFGLDSNLVHISEDIGRHNAMDKLVGTIIESELMSTEMIVFVSGRASFELVQKAIRAGFPILASVGAASSYAIDLAREHDLTLLSFAKGDRFVIHSSPHRVII